MPKQATLLPEDTQEQRKKKLKTAIGNFALVLPMIISLRLWLLARDRLEKMIKGDKL